MADIKTLSEKLKAIREAVQAKLPDIAATLAITGKALAERNIKDHGFAKQYSQNRIPVFFLEGKELNLRGTAFLKEKKKKDQQNTRQQDGVKYYPADYGTNWREFREAQGLQGLYVDLSYSNKMWANMGPVAIEQRAGIFYAMLGGTNIEAQDKMNWNFERFGSFIRLALGQSEDNLLKEVVNEEIVKVISQF